MSLRRAGDPLQLQQANVALAVRGAELFLGRSLAALELAALLIGRTVWGRRQVFDRTATEAAADAAPGSDLYVDWERSNLYKLERGEGECAV